MKIIDNENFGPALIMIGMLLLVLAPLFDSGATPC